MFNTVLGGISLESAQFEERKKYSEASGTMAVVDSNIEMKMNQYGLYEEKIIDTEKDVSQLAQSVSPNFNTAFNETKIANELYGQNKNIHFDERLGYYNSLYVGHVVEGDYRRNASSGGMGTWILKELFEKGLVDHIIHVKKSEDNEKLFQYDISSSLSEIQAGAKTRYYPVEISEVIKKVKETPGNYAVIGIPSFIYAIRLLAKQDEIVNERIKYTVGLICGHQKSSKFAEAMAWQVGIEPGNLLDIDFRHKLTDRPANQYGVKMVGYIEGELKTIVKPKDELFGQDWGWGLFKPTASNFTDDVFNETADIVLGDAWLSEYELDSEGNNIVIVRNTEISQLIVEAINSNRLKMDSVNKELVFKSQSSHYRHTHDELAYRLYKKDIEHEWRPQKRVEASNDISNSRRKVQDLREELAYQSHLIYAEAVKKNDFHYFEKSLEPITDEYKRVYRFMNKKKLLGRLKKLGPKGIFNKVIEKIRK